MVGVTLPDMDTGEMRYWNFVVDVGSQPSVGYTVTFHTEWPSADKGPDHSRLSWLRPKRSGGWRWRRKQKRN